MCAVGEWFCWLLLVYSFRNLGTLERGWDSNTSSAPVSSSSVSESLLVNALLRQYLVVGRGSLITSDGRGGGLPDLTSRAS